MDEEIFQRATRTNLAESAHEVRILGQRRRVQAILHELSNLVLRE
jgi:hypothetical protein